MKKLLLLLFIFSGLISFSQIVINSNDLVKPGDIIVMANDVDPVETIVPGPPGENQTWDFSALVMDESDTSWVIMPDWSPFGVYFPTANYGMINYGDTVFSFMNLSEEQFLLQGIVIDVEFLGPVALPFDPGEVIAEFPVQYGNSNAQTFVNEIKFAIDTLLIDSVMLKIETQKNTEIDAWGSITTPMGTFEALRAHETSTVVDSFWIHMPIIGWLPIDSLNITYTTDTYSWWSNDEDAGFIVAEMEMNTIDETVLAVQYLKEKPFLDIEEDYTQYDIQVYPNPCSDQLSVKVDQDINAYFRVYDITGKLCLEKELAGKQFSFNLDNLDPGFYLYQLVSMEEGLLDSGKLVIE